MRAGFPQFPNPHHRHPGRFGTPVCPRLSLIAAQARLEQTFFADPSDDPGRPPLQRRVRPSVRRPASCAVRPGSRVKSSLEPTSTPHLPVRVSTKIGRSLGARTFDSEPPSPSRVARLCPECAPPLLLARSGLLHPAPALVPDPIDCRRGLSHPVLATCTAAPTTSCGRPLAPRPPDAPSPSSRATPTATTTMPPRAAASGSALSLFRTSRPSSSRLLSSVLPGLIRGAMFCRRIASSRPLLHSAETHLLLAPLPHVAALIPLV